MGRRSAMREGRHPVSVTTLRGPAGGARRGGQIPSRAPERACEIGGPLRSARGADRGCETEATEARRIAAESSANVASLAADLAKRPVRDEVEARASEAFAAATKDAHAAIAAAEDRFAQRSDDDARKLVALVTSRDRATRAETRQAISKAQETARSRGAAAAAELRKSLDGRFKAEALAREEEKRRLERRCDVLSREADALHKAYELLRDEVRQNVREGCEFAVASANDASDAV